MPKTIHKYREDQQYKILKSLLPNLSQLQIDKIYLTNPHDGDKVEELLNNLSLDPKIESKVLKLMFTSWDK